MSVLKTMNVRVSTTQLGLLPPAIRYSLSRWRSYYSWFAPLFQSSVLCLSGKCNAQKRRKKWCTLVSHRRTAVKACILIRNGQGFFLLYSSFLASEATQRRRRSCEWNEQKKKNIYSIGMKFCCSRFFLFNPAFYRRYLDAKACLLLGTIMLGMLKITNWKFYGTDSNSINNK